MSARLPELESLMALHQGGENNKSMAERLDSFNNGELKGINKLFESLKTNSENGLSEVDIEHRRQKYGNNELPVQPVQSIWEMFVESFEDETLRILMIAAFVSVVVGLYDSYNSHWVKSSYIEGVAIFIAIFLVAGVTSWNNYKKEMQFQNLNKKSDDVDVKVIRGGADKTIKATELVVGDIVRLSNGDKVPADGIMFENNKKKECELEVDESALTGESEQVKKSARGNCFLTSSSLIKQGEGLMLVTSVGKNSFDGLLRLGLQENDEEKKTPLQEKLDLLAQQIGNIGTYAAIATFGVMVIMWCWDSEVRRKHITSGEYPECAGDLECAQKYFDPDNVVYWDLIYNKYFFHYVLKAFIMGVTIVVVAVPEGLPLAVTLSLSYSTMKMMDDNNLIRVLDAVETMGNATSLCSDKTGTLTLGNMIVTSAYIDNIIYEKGDLKSANFTTAIKYNMSVNNSANYSKKLNAITNKEEFVGEGNQSEVAMLKLLKAFDHNYSADRAEVRDSQNFPYDSDTKYSALLVRSQNKIEHGPIVLIKGGHETVLKFCAKKLGEKRVSELLKQGDRFCADGKRVFAFAHKIMAGRSGPQDRNALMKDLNSECTFDGMICIHDPLREESKDAVMQCQAAGISVRMITGDHEETAKKIAEQCGIWTTKESHGAAGTTILSPQLHDVLKQNVIKKKVMVLNKKTKELESKEWEYSQELHRRLKEMQVIARATPSDKNIIIRHLQEQGEIVGVTGDGTNDAPALKTADVGLAMNSGTDVAKDAADIIIMDDNFASIVKAVVWGRCTFDNIRKFLQFQLTVNATALIFTFLAAVKGEEPPLNAVMMLWVNLIMDTFGALALGTETPNAEKLLDRLPYKKDASLISNAMWKNIIFQTIFQLGALTLIQTRFGDIFGSNVFIPGAQADQLASIDVCTRVEGGCFVDNVYALQGMDDFKHRYTNTILFNVFVFCQVFNELNSRSIDDDDVNIIYGLTKNFPFMLIMFVTCGCQFLWVAFGGNFIQTTPLLQGDWLKCIALASISIFVGLIMRFFPSGKITDFIELSEFQGAIQKSAKKALEMKKISQRARDVRKTISNVVYYLLAIGCIPFAFCVLFEKETASYKGSIVQFFARNPEF